VALLVTGGAGFIGSHACVELINKNYKIVIIDDLINSNIDVIKSVGLITGKPIDFHRINLLDHSALKKLFEKYNFDAVIHFAGYKSVNESIKKPMKYYFNNLYGTMVLCDVMREFNVKKIIFSSSATVYGNSKNSPIKENAATKVVNPYGESKLLVENYLDRLVNKEKKWKIIILRYFNPIGAHESGLIGEEPIGLPNNLMPYLLMVASKKLNELMIFGNDYPTNDGTGIRDYIHVCDLALAHISALEFLKASEFVDEIIEKINIGTGVGYSVREIIRAFIEYNKVTIPTKVVSRRVGDAAISFADPSYAYEKLGWRAKKTLKDMCIDSWKWETQRQNKCADENI
jgi:UDP-glucose 4-epimerase